MVSNHILIEYYYIMWLCYNSLSTLYHLTIIYNYYCKPVILYKSVPLLAIHVHTHIHINGSVFISYSLCSWLQNQYIAITLIKSSRYPAIITACCLVSKLLSHHLVGTCLNGQWRRLPGQSRRCNPQK